MNARLLRRSAVLLVLSASLASAQEKAKDPKAASDETPRLQETVDVEAELPALPPLTGAATRLPAPAKDLPFTLSVVPAQPGARPGCVRAERRPQECQRGQRLHRLRGLRLLHDARPRLPHRWPRPQRWGLRARVHVLSHVQRAAGRGAEGARELPLRRRTPWPERCSSCASSRRRHASARRHSPTGASGPMRARSTATSRPPTARWPSA